MILEAWKIEEALGQIEHGLNTYKSNPVLVEGLVNAMNHLTRLREEYFMNRRLLDAYKTRLQDLAERFHEALREAGERLAGEYIEANLAINDWRKRQKMCRNLIIELAGLDGLDKLDAPAGQIKVSSSQSLALPKTGSPERDALSALITDSGQWAEVGIVNALKLKKALDEGRFSPAQAGRIATLCPEKVSYRLTVPQDSRAQR